MGAPEVNIPEGPEVLVLIHGTGVPVDTSHAPAEPSWNHPNSFFVKKLKEEFGPDNFPFEVQSFTWSGLNLESERRLAAAELLNKLMAFEKSRRGYHIIAHSHGGSVAWTAFQQAVSENASELPGLRSWTTVGTPFLHFQPVLSRVATFLVFLVAVALVSLMGWVSWSQLSASGIKFSTPWQTLASSVYHAWSDGLWGRLCIAALFIFTAAFAFFAIQCLLVHPLRQWKAWRRLNDGTAQRAWEKFGKSWFGIYAKQDEAIAALEHTVNLGGRIIPGQFFGFEKIGDAFIWAMLTARSQGDDTAMDRVIGVSPVPVVNRHEWPAIPDDIVESLTADVKSTSATALEKLRDKLLTVRENSSSAIGLFWEFLNQLSWGELIHTSYFPSHARPKFTAVVQLIALNINQATKHLDEQKQREHSLLARRGRSRIRDWYLEVTQARDTAPATHPENAPDPFRSLLRVRIALRCAALVTTAIVSIASLLYLIPAYSDKSQIAQIISELPGLLGTVRSEHAPFAEMQAFNEGPSIDMSSIDDLLSGDVMPTRVRRLTRLGDDPPQSADEEFIDRIDAMLALTELVTSSRLADFWKSLDLSTKMRIGLSAVKAIQAKTPNSAGKTADYQLAFLTQVGRDLSVDGIERVLRDPTANRGLLFDDITLRNTQRNIALEQAFIRASSRLGNSIAADGSPISATTFAGVTKRSIPIMRLIESQLRLKQKDEVARFLMALSHGEQLFPGTPQSRLTSVFNHCDERNGPFLLPVAHYIFDDTGDDAVPDVAAEYKNFLKEKRKALDALKATDKADTDTIGKLSSGKSMSVDDWDTVRQLREKSWKTREELSKLESLFWTERYPFTPPPIAIAPRPPKADLQPLAENSSTRSEDEKESHKAWLGWLSLSHIKTIVASLGSDSKKAPIWARGTTIDQAADIIKDVAQLPEVTESQIRNAVYLANQLHIAGFDERAREVIKCLKLSDGTWPIAKDRVIAFAIAEMAYPISEEGRELAASHRRVLRKHVRDLSYTIRPPHVLQLASLSLASLNPGEADPKSQSERLGELLEIGELLKSDVILLNNDTPGRSDFWRIAQQAMYSRVLDRLGKSADASSQLASAWGHLNRIEEKNVKARASLGVQVASAYFDIGQMAKAASVARWANLECNRVTSDSDRSLIRRELAHVFAQIGDFPRAYGAAYDCVPSHRLYAYSIILIHASMQFGSPTSSVKGMIVHPLLLTWPSDLSGPVGAPAIPLIPPAPPEA